MPGRKGKRKPIPWAEIEDRYVTDRAATLRGLAREYGCAQSSVQSHSVAGDWARKRQDYTEQLRAKMVEDSATRIADLSSRHAAQSLHRLGELQGLIVELLTGALRSGQQITETVVTVEDETPEGKARRTTTRTRSAHVETSRLAATVLREQTRLLARLMAPAAGDGSRGPESFEEHAEAFQDAREAALGTVPAPSGDAPPGKDPMAPVDYSESGDVTGPPELPPAGGGQ